MIHVCGFQTPPPKRRRRSQPDRIEAPHYALSMTEKQFQALVVETAQTFGWHAFHFRNMLTNPAGWPDLTIIKGEITLWVELKSEKGTLEESQIRMAQKFAEVGATIHCWRPSDWERIVDTLRGDIEVLR